jgi:hypothetical protein
VHWPRNEAASSHPSSAEVKNGCSYNSASTVQRNVMYTGSLPSKYILWVQCKVTTGLERADFHLILNVTWQLNNSEFDFMF